MSPESPRMRWTRHLFGVIVVTSMVLAAGCGGSETTGDETADETATSTAETPAADAPAADAPRVYFVEPADGATLSAAEPVHVMFDVQNFEIEPVGEGMVHEGFGHHHLAIDGECLAAGEVIPKADPWIHFGDGTNMIDVQLTPGEHTLTLQVGDGEHRTLDEPGLCATITVEVEAAEG